MLLTQQPNISPSAALSVLVARHQHAAVVILQQVLITQSTSADRATFLCVIYWLGASNRTRIDVAYMDVGQEREQERKLCGF